MDEGGASFLSLEGNLDERESGKFGRTSLRG